MLLTIGYDKDLLDPTSGAAARHREYARHFEAIHLIVFSRSEGEAETVDLGEGVYAHKTAGGSPLAVLKSAYAIGKRILEEGSVRRGMKGVETSHAGMTPLRAQGKSVNNAEWVISTQDPFECALVGYLLKRATGVPLQIQEHGDFFSRPYWRQESLLNRARYLLGRFLLPRADGVRVVSERIKRALLARGVAEERITVVPVYTEVEEFETAAPDHGIEALCPEGGLLVLSMARFVPQKNLCVLLRAWRAVVKEVPSARLALVGQGAERRQLLAHARDLMPEKVTFIDWTENPAGAMKAADVYALPSDYEGWGRVCVEALAAGTPLVTTDVGCVGEVVVHEESGLVVPPRDSDALAHALVRVLRDEALRAKLKEGGVRAIDTLKTKEECIALYVESVRACAHNLPDARHPRESNGGDPE